MDQGANDSTGLLHWLGYAAGAIGTALTAVFGYGFTQYTRDRSRLVSLEQHDQHVDGRLDTLAVALDDVIERQDQAEETQAGHSIVLAKIETDVSWMRRWMESGRPHIPDGYPEP